MKTPLPSSRPRLVCRVVRYVHAWQDDETSEHGVVNRHAAGCDDCSQYFENVREWEVGLGQPSHSSPLKVPEGLEDRIWAAVRTEVAARRGPTPAPWWSGWRPLAAGALAAIAIMAVWVNQAPSHDPGKDRLAAAVGGEFSEADLRELVSSIETYSTQFLASGLGRAQREAQPNPLEQELSALENDARGAWRFLERNFLPSAESSESST